MLNKEGPQKTSEFENVGLQEWWQNAENIVQLQESRQNTEKEVVLLEL